MAEFLHKKVNSSLWYFRRRYPVDVAKLVGKTMHIQSLRTANRREAEKLCRAVSVQFDAICAKARLEHKFQEEKRQAEPLMAQRAESKLVDTVPGSNSQRDPESVLARIPELMRLAAIRVVEEQQRDPRGWLDTIQLWKDFYSSALAAPMPSPGPQTAIEAKACLNGIELAIQGQPVPSAQLDVIQQPIVSQLGAGATTETWSALCDRALHEYQHKVAPERCKLAKSLLQQLNAGSVVESDIQDSLREWCNARLLKVQPRTVKGQLDCMVAALRCALPKLTAPVLRELQGVMQPCVGDRQSIPIKIIRAAVHAFRSRALPTKVRRDYGGGASQFDAIAVEVLAVLGMRPRELITARPNALVTQVDVLGEEGLFLRLVCGKNKASEREIPLSDGVREVLPVQQLREMLEWQDKNTRSIAGAVTSLGTRFKAMTKGYTLYQMRHSWKDLAVHVGVDLELRERLMGHKMPGVSAVYGSGIPLNKGLDALLSIREIIFDERDR